MKLPDRLDYIEVNVPDEDHPDRTAYPEVFCTVAGCSWTYGAWWDEFATDGDTDWGELHPPHDADHSVSVGENGYVAACGADVLVDALGYHCVHIEQMAFADVVEMEPANKLPGPLNAR